MPRGATSGSPEDSVGPWQVRDRYTMQKEFGYRIYLLDYGGVRERRKEREVGGGDREGKRETGSSHLFRRTIREYWKDETGDQLVLVEGK